MPYKDKSRRNQWQRERRYPQNPIPVRRQRAKRKYWTKEYLASVKEGKSCMDCGRSYPGFVMDFDHVRGQKEFELSRAHKRQITVVRLAEEVAKCDLVCANCHRIRTFTRQQHLGLKVEKVSDQKSLF